jgi:O-antigen/teichoic acid export membrane protein
VVPAVMVQDMLRFAAISGGRPFVAVVSDGLWTISIASAFLANILGGAVSARVAVALWGASGLLAALLLAAALGIRPKVDRIPDWWKTYAGARVHFGLGDALAPIYTAAVLFAVTLIANSSVAGALRGATTLFGPIALLFSALPLIFVPHARRSVASPREQWRLLVKVSWISSALTAAATAVFVVLPHGLGVAILGETWNSAVEVIPYEGLLSVAAIWMTSIYLLFQTQGRSRAAFWTRMLQLVAQLTGAITAAAIVGTAIAIVGTSAGFCWLAVIVSVICARRVARGSNEHDVLQGISDHPAKVARPVGGRPQSGMRPWPVIDVLEKQVSRSR